MQNSDTMTGLVDEADKALVLCMMQNSDTLTGLIGEVDRALVLCMMQNSDTLPVPLRSLEALLMLPMFFSVESRSSSYNSGFIAITAHITFATLRGEHLTFRDYIHVKL